MKRQLQKALRFLLVNSLPEELFDSRVTLTTAKRLFRTYVKLVELENHSYCNRVCWFCPNATLDRRSDTIPMDPKLYGRILDDLAEIEYAETLVWARYHEPMADQSLYANLRTARRRLPRAFLTVHTNGDYLNRESIIQMEETGINQVRVNLYVANGQPYTKEAVGKIVRQLLDRTGLDIVEDGRRRLTGSQLHMPLNIPDFSRPKSMSSRGSLVQVSGLKTYRRLSACLSPLQHVVVDYNGVGMLCCQVRSDAPEHREARIADLNRPGYTLFHFYRDLAAARRGLVSSGTKHGVCMTCTSNEGGPYRWGRTPGLARSLGMIPGYSRLVNSAWKARRRRYDPS